MFSMLSGRPLFSYNQLNDDSVTIDVNGVGYEVFCSRTTYSFLENNKDHCQVFIETHVREDRIQLFGFRNLEEKQWFRLLMTVQGVGAKVAFAILSIFDEEQIYQVLMTKDAKSLTQADGVGPRLATRILTELENKVPTLSSMATASPQGIMSSSSLSSKPSSHMQDALSALTNLGYKPFEVNQALQTVLQNQKDEDMSLSDLIRLGLQQLSREGVA